MERQRASRPTVTIPAGCRDDVVPMSDRRAEPLTSVDVGQVVLGSLVAGFDWPGPDPITHLVLATVDGRGRLSAGDQELELGPGSVAVCPARVPRRHRAAEPWQVVTIRIGDTARWSRFHETAPFVLEGQDSQRFAAPVSGMLAELPRGVTSVSQASQGREPMQEILSRFAGRLHFEPSPSSGAVATDPFSLHATILRIHLEALLEGPPASSPDERRLLGLWEAVRREPGRDWRVEALAAQLNVSRATLHRLVARHHDRTPGAIVERIRMDHAAHLLAHGDLPIKAIAAQVGYATPYSFSAAFRRSRGCPPSAFRRRVDGRAGF